MKELRGLNVKEQERAILQEVKQKRAYDQEHVRFGALFRTKVPTEFERVLNRLRYQVTIMNIGSNSNNTKRYSLSIK